MFWKGGGAGNSFTVWKRSANFVSKSLTIRLIFFVCVADDGVRGMADVVRCGGGGGFAGGAYN